MEPSTLRTSTTQNPDILVGKLFFNYQKQQVKCNDFEMTFDSFVTVDFLRLSTGTYFKKPRCLDRKGDGTF